MRAEHRAHGIERPSKGCHWVAPDAWEIRGACGRRAMRIHALVVAAVSMAMFFQSASAEQKPNVLKPAEFAKLADQGKAAYVRSVSDALAAIGVGLLTAATLQRDMPILARILDTGICASS